MIEKQCARCGNTFAAVGHNSKITKYCSKACRAKVYAEKKAQKNLLERGIFIRNDAALDDLLREAREHGMTYGKYIAWRDRAIYGARDSSVAGLPQNDRSEELQHEHIHRAPLQEGLPE